jgi:CRISPR-associated protein Cas5d
MLNYNEEDAFYTIEFGVEGEFGLFTRPEMRVMPMSYSIPTESALNQMIKSVHWHPEFDLRATAVKVMSVPEFECMMINARQLVKASSTPKQMTMTMLKKPNYLIRAKLFWVDGTSRDQRNVGKVVDIFRRRIERGVCGRELSIGKSRCRCGGTVYQLDKPWEEYVSPLVGKSDFGMMYFDTDYTTGIKYMKHMTAIDGEIDYGTTTDLIAMPSNRIGG